ncbi:MAG: site-specific integrase, partial [Ruminococcaceae bacterium]|nr:site-specific integrase [Oscillospiraceae bacterium]
MTGSLQVKNGKFYIVLNTYENGKRKPKWVSTGLCEKGNKRKAEQLLREAIQRAEMQNGIVPSDISFADYVRYWLQQVKRRVDEVTYQGYETLAQGHILPYFDRAGISLQKITRAHLQAYIDEKAAHGRKDGKGGLSARSLRLHKNILYQTLTEAVKNELLAANPCQHVELPPTIRYEASYYTAEQLQTLLAAIANDPLAPMIAVTIIYGLRRSELLGLKWDSIDFERGLVTIKHTVSKVSKVVEKDKTKNASSRRSFPLTDDARIIFLQAKADEENNRQLMGKGYQQNSYVFKWPDGRPFSPDYVSRHFSRLLKSNNLPHIRFHDLRHPYVKHTTKIFSLRLKFFQAQPVPDALRKTRGAFLHLWK